MLGFEFQLAMSIEDRSGWVPPGVWSRRAVGFGRDVRRGDWLASSSGVVGFEFWKGAGGGPVGLELSGAGIERLATMARGADNVASPRSIPATHLPTPKRRPT